MELIDPLLFGEEQGCFGCGPHNPVGMQLQFYREGDTVQTTLESQEGWEGPPGILHGGLQATLADEVGAWTVVGVLGCFGFTEEISLRYLRSARTGHPLVARGTLVEHEGPRALVKIELEQQGRIVAEGQARYVMPTAGVARRMLGIELPDAWKRLARQR